MNDYLVELLLDRPVALCKRALAAALGERLGRVEVVEPSSELLVFHLPAIRVARRGVESPYCVVMHPPQPIADRAGLDAALAHTWDWPGAADAAARATASITLHDQGAGSLDPARRLETFHRVAEVAARVTGAAAIHWLPSERVVDARTLARRVAAYGPLAGAALNVRQFKVGDGDDGETLLDTVGMAALGLPDVQCRFAGVPPERVAAMVGGCADFLLRHGDVIRDGETLDRTAERWTCRRKESLVEPRRVVLAVEPRSRARASAG